MILKKLNKFFFLGILRYNLRDFILGLIVVDRDLHVDVTVLFLVAQLRQLVLAVADVFRARDVRARCWPLVEFLFFSLDEFIYFGSVSRR